MTRIQANEQEESQEEVFEPLSAEQAQELRKSLPLLSVWRVIAAQLLFGLLLAAVLYGLFRRQSVAISALYGSFAVILPASLFARGLGSPLSRISVGSAVLGFFLWEMTKIGLTLAMLIAAPYWLKENLSWPAMLAGLLVAMKVYWLALGLGRVFYKKLQH
jgi:ATP synthase protein I